MFYFLRNKLISISLVVLFLSACSGDNDIVVDSDTVSTGRIYATFQVISEGGDRVFSEAQLTRNAPPRDSNDSTTFVRLVGNDVLWFSAGSSVDDIDFSDNIFGDLDTYEDQHTTFSPSTTPRGSYFFLWYRLILNDFGTWYSASLPQSENENTPYFFSLFRDNATTADSSSVTISPAFSIVAPQDNTAFSRSSDDIIIEWDNTDPQASIEIEVNFTCSFSDTFSFSAVIDTDPGIYTIPAGDLDMIDGGGDCSATLSVRKVHLGQFDSAFVGGTVNSYQIRKVVFRSEN
ncbi:MAG: hypothetical protein COA42_05130 [Alteromonadaceae bacterium]|nr:MAG: hypothetical protein COA42_05130 [Alteromonadaceae bacterium]